MHVCVFMCVYGRPSHRLSVSAPIPFMGKAMIRFYACVCKCVYGRPSHRLSLSARAIEL
jgi:hypothetical protein